MPHSKVKVTRENTINVLALWCEKKIIFNMADPEIIHSIK